MDCDRRRGFHRDCVQPVRDRHTQQRRNRSVSRSAIERKICVLVTLTVRSLSRAPGSLLRTRTPRPTLIQLASNCAISDKERALIWLYASLDSEHSDPSHGRRKRQTNCNRCEKDQRIFRPKCVQSNRYWLASGDLRVRAVTVKSVNFAQDRIRPPAESSTSFQIRRLTTALS